MMKHKMYLLVGVLWSLTSFTYAFNSQEQASKHAMTVNKPAPDFFEGALLGNGGLGVVVTTRPDAVCLHFGHNNV